MSTGQIERSTAKAILHRVDPFCAISGLLLVCYGAFIATFAKSGFSPAMEAGLSLPYLSDKPVGEDGYYMLLVAWNFANGKGFVANYDAVTTGVQPLSVLLFSVIAKVVQIFGGSKWDFVRAIIGFGTLNALIFSFACGRLSQCLVSDDESKKFAFRAAFVMSALSFYFFATFTHGLETGIYLTFIAITIERGAAYLSGRRLGARQIAIFGVLIGLTGLSRIDFGIVTAVFLLAFVVFGRLRLGDAIMMGMTAILVTAPWFIWVHSVSGAWIPSSGPAQAGFVDLQSLAPRRGAMLRALAQNLVPWLYLGKQKATIAIVLSGIVALYYVATRGRSKPINWRKENWQILAIFAASLLTLPLVYIVLFWATHFYARYTAPIAVVAIAFAGAMSTGVPQPIRRVFFLGLFCAILILNAALAVSSLHMGFNRNSMAVAAGYVFERLPRDEKVGAFQSGVMGYYNSNVVNLDGKMNWEALRALKTNRLEAYLEDAGIFYVVDWQSEIQGHMSDGTGSGRWIPCTTPIPNKKFICVMRNRRSDAHAR